MNRHIVIHTGDTEVGNITSVVPVEAPPTIGDIYSIGVKNFEVVDFFDDGEVMRVLCQAYIDPEGAVQ